MRHAIALLLLTFALAGCETTGATSEPTTMGTDDMTMAAAPPAPILHLVFFKLNNAGLTHDLIADCDRYLAGIPSVTVYHRGVHLDTGRGDRVDGDYDVCLTIGFDSEEGYAAYVDHPDHVALVEKWGASLTWVRVHDAYDPR